jgi:hypothetical protein
VNLPWMRFHTRDWLDNKELRRCSASARAILADLMCLAHEGEPYGHLADKVGPLTVKYMASRCVVTTGQFLKAIAELTKHERIKTAESGALFVERMVEDEELRLKMAEGGRKGGNPNLRRKVGGEVNLPDNPEDKHARTRADSGSGSLSPTLEFQRKPAQVETPKPAEHPSRRFAEFWALYPVKDNRPISEGVFVSLVTTANEGAVFACLRRYLDSDRGARSPKNPANWLHDCARDQWESDWPKARDATPQPQGTVYKRVDYDSDGNVIYG